MSYESDVQPIKLGIPFDFMLPGGFPDELWQDYCVPFEMVFEEGRVRGLIDRPIELVFRQSKGSPKGTVKAVIDAYGELVDEGCLAGVGPFIADNSVLDPRVEIERRFRVPSHQRHRLRRVARPLDLRRCRRIAHRRTGVLGRARSRPRAGHTEVGALVEESLVGDAYIPQLPQGLRRAGHPRRAAE